MSIVLVSGNSGAGKSTVATILQNMIGLDDCYRASASSYARFISPTVDIEFIRLAFGRTIFVDTFLKKWKASGKQYAILDGVDQEDLETFLTSSHQFVHVFVLGENRKMTCPHERTVVCEKTLTIPNHHNHETLFGIVKNLYELLKK